MTGLRIVSLLPAATELVVALGAEAQLVGRSHECDHPASVADRPILTKPRIEPSRPSHVIHDDVQAILANALSLYEVDEVKLAELAPDVVITQDQCTVCAVDLQSVERAVARAVGKNVQIVSMRPDGLEDVLQDWLRVARAIGKPTEGVKLITQLRTRMAGLRAGLRGIERQTVLCLEWIEPPMTAGNWVPELVEAAGGVPLLAKAGEHSPVVTWDAIAAAKPDMVVVMACGFDIERTRRELEALRSNPAWTGLAAVREGRVFVTDGNAFFNRPGPRTLATLEALAEMLHGQTMRHEGTVWQNA